MGVQHLWDLLAAAGLPARIEALVGKKCAIDASFWLNHCLASESNMRHGGDVVGVFFLRICYLLEKGIKPIFVFDGKPPTAKRKTLIKRKLLQNKRQINYNLLAFKALALQIRRSTNSNTKRAPDKNYFGSKNKKNILSVGNQVNGICVPDDFDFLANENADILKFANDHIDKNIFESSNSSQDIKFRDSCNSHSLLYPSDDFLEDDHHKGDSDLLGDFRFNESDISIEAIVKSSSFNDDVYHKITDKMKYEVMNQIRETRRADARKRSIELKESISDYSRHQVESYIKDVAILHEIEKLKQKMAIHAPGAIKEELHPSASNNLLADEIYDYNSIHLNRIKRKKFINHFNAITISEFSPMKPDVPKTTLPVNYVVDESVFATDEEIFGDLLSRESDDDNLHSFCMKKGTPDEEFDLIDTPETPEIDFSDINVANNTDPKEYEIRSHEDFVIKEEKLKDYDSDTCDGGKEAYMPYPKLSHSEDLDLNDLENVSKADPKDTKSFHDSPLRYTLVPNRNSTIIQDHHDAIQRILNLFGIPYIVAPSEAESQCAHLNKSGVCYAVITDDSDALVFGAHCVLKNFYNNNIFEIYTSERLFSQLGIGRQELALIAIICGCDYTTGIKGIGIINALEVIKAYPTFDDLYDFRKWATSDCDLETAVFDTCPLRKAYKETHINYRVHWSFSSDFPNREAYNLFLHPNVTDTFDLSWKDPNIPEILMFMQQNSSLPKEEVECCVNALMIKKSYQFIIEDIIPEIYNRRISVSSLKHARKTLNTNLSSFRKIVSTVSARAASKKAIYIDKPEYYISKISSKRMLNSIISIKERSRKSKCSDSSRREKSP